MPIIPVAIAIGSAVTATVSAVATGIGVAIGATAGALVTAGTAIVSGLTSTVGAVLRIKGVAGAIAGAATSTTIQAVMAKKAQGEVLQAQEQEALRFYEQENKARAEREYATILAEENRKLEIEKQTELNIYERKIQAEQEEKFIITSTQGQQIETLTNLISASSSLRSQPQAPTPIPVFLTTPAPERAVSWFDNINNTIHNWFN